PQGPPAAGRVLSGRAPGRQRGVGGPRSDLVDRARTSARVLWAGGGRRGAGGYAMGPPQAAVGALLLLPGQRGRGALRAVRAGGRALRAMGARGHARRRARRRGGTVTAVARGTTALTMRVRRSLTRVTDVGAGHILHAPDPGRRRAVLCYHSVDPSPGYLS